MRRRLSPLPLIALAALLEAVGAQPLHPAVAAAPATRPNIVFILADDLGYGDLSCYGCFSIASRRGAAASRPRGSATGNCCAGT